MARDALAQSASHVQTILDNVKDAIVTVDGVGGIETCNPMGERIFGYARVEILWRTLDFVLPEIDPDDVRGALVLGPVGRPEEVRHDGRVLLTACPSLLQSPTDLQLNCS